MLTNKCQNTKYVQCNHKLHCTTTQFYKQEIWETKIKRVKHPENTLLWKTLNNYSAQKTIVFHYAHEQVHGHSVYKNDAWYYTQWQLITQVRAITEMTPVTVKPSCVHTVGLACTNVLWIKSYTENLKNTHSHTQRTRQY